MRKIMVNKAISITKEIMYLDGGTQTVWINYNFSVPMLDV